MAESHPRAARPGKSRPARALLLASVIAAIVLSALFAARSASAAPLAKSAPAATAASAATTAPAVTAERAATAGQAGHLAENQLTSLITVAAPDAGICNVPGVGDIGGLIGLCKAGQGLLGDVNNVCIPGPPTAELANSADDV